MLTMSEKIIGYKFYFRGKVVRAIGASSVEEQRAKLERIYGPGIDTADVLEWLRSIYAFHTPGCNSVDELRYATIVRKRESGIFGRN